MPLPFRLFWALWSLKITCDRVRGQRGQPFCRSSGQPTRGQNHLSLLQRLVTRTLTGVVLVLVPLGYASPPDPTWIAGIYDNADYDDVVELVTDGTGVSSGQAPARVEQGPVAFALLSEPGPLLHRTLRAQMSRGPPVEARDTSVNFQSSPRHDAERYLPRGLLVADQRPAKRSSGRYPPDQHDHVPEASLVPQRFHAVVDPQTQWGFLFLRGPPPRNRARHCWSPTTVKVGSSI